MIVTDPAVTAQNVPAPMTAAGQRPAGSLKPARTLYPGRPAITAQTKHNTAEIERVADTGLSAVITLPSDRRIDRWTKLREALSAYRAVAGDPTHCLVDANRYAGSKRTIGVADLDTTWVDTQLNAGLAFALTDSPYIPTGDREALRHVLTQAKAMKRPVIATLPLGKGWLTHHSRDLREEIDRAGVPVGLILEHPKDPLGTQAAVRGLVDVLKAEPLVHMLRCDTSAIAAIAYGAAGGAIGTTTALRHLYPMPEEGKGGGGGNAKVAAWVPQLMTYVSLEKISDLVVNPSVTQYLTCWCTLCNGLTLDCIANEQEAYTHSFFALTDFADVIGQSATPEAQRQAFNAHAQQAQFAHLEIEALGVPNQAPDFIGAWRKAYFASQSSGQ
jgi:hypothetical protein